MSGCLSSPTCQDLGIPPSDKYSMKDGPIIGSCGASAGVKPDLRGHHGCYDSTLHPVDFHASPAAAGPTPPVAHANYCANPYGCCPTGYSNCHLAVGSPIVVETPIFVHKRNERERERVRCVNEGYARLRQHLPLENKDKRVSKVETLRYAIQYINHLQQILNSTKNKDGVESEVAGDCNASAAVDGDTESAN